MKIAMIYTTSIHFISYSIPHSTKHWDDDYICQYAISMVIMPHLGSLSMQGSIAVWVIIGLFNRPWQYKLVFYDVLKFPVITSSGKYSYFPVTWQPWFTPWMLSHQIAYFLSITIWKFTFSDLLILLMICWWTLHCTWTMSLPNPCTRCATELNSFRWYWHEKFCNYYYII